MTSHDKLMQTILITYRNRIVYIYQIAIIFYLPFFRDVNVFPDFIPHPVPLEITAYVLVKS